MGDSAEQIGPGEKRCTICGIVKRFDEFSRDNRAVDGRKSRCKLCQKVYAMEYHIKNKDAISARKRRKYAELKGGAESVVTLLYCPRDAVLGIPLFPYPRTFSRTQFQDTLRMGTWPVGAEFRYAKVYGGTVARWRVVGRRLKRV